MKAGKGASAFKKLQEFTVAFPLQVGYGDEPQGRGIDAVAESPGLGGTVAEDVSEMGIGARASHLGPTMPKERSLLSMRAFSETGFEKAGQPQPESNLSSEENRACPLITST